MYIILIKIIFTVLLCNYDIYFKSQKYHQIQKTLYLNTRILEDTITCYNIYQIVIRIIMKSKTHKHKKVHKQW